MAPFTEQLTIVISTVVCIKTSVLAYYLTLGLLVYFLVICRYLVEIAGDLGSMGGKIWRIGLLGHNCNLDNINLVLKALGEALAHVRKSGC